MKNTDLKKAKAALAFAQVNEGRLIYNANNKAETQICNSQSSFEVLKPFFAFAMESFEEFRMIALNRANKVIGVILISSGGTAGTAVDPKMIFASALLSGAHAIILAHNHPSGMTKPSQPDIDLTRKLVTVGNCLDISVLDHIILSANGYYSFADEGNL